MVGAFGEVHVLDWGLAKVLGSPSVSPSHETGVWTVRSDQVDSGSTPGSVLGTPTYMPSEQAQGKIGELDVRSDVFALGAMLCELLTGAPPYRGTSPGETLDLAAARRIEDAFTRLDTSGADRELVALAREALAPEIAARPRNAGVLAAKLSTYLSRVEERAQAERVAAAEARVKAQAARRAQKLTAALSASIVLTVALAALGWWWSESERAKRARTCRQRRRQGVERSRAPARRGSHRQRWRGGRVARKVYYETLPCRVSSQLPSDLVGSQGGALGYEGWTLGARTECHPSFAVEMDNWIGGGESKHVEGGAPRLPGYYHFGLNVNSSVTSPQNNTALGVRSARYEFDPAQNKNVYKKNLPDIFSEQGIHVTIQYAPSGKVSVRLRGAGIPFSVPSDAGKDLRVARTCPHLLSPAIECRPMRDIRLATAQFEARDGDKEHNLERLRELAVGAARQQAEAVLFHECCITGYTFLQTLTRQQLLELAEPVPGGPATRRLEALARELGITILAGLLERDGDHLHNTCVAVGPRGFLARHRKIHTFISPHLAPGDSYSLFDLNGVRAGILICYDNNLPENVRVTSLLGAEVIFMPHVTCGTDSPMPGRGRIGREVWEARERDPVRCRQEFRGPKGREWLLKWLPARAYENGVYAVFANAVGIDHDTVKTGNAMIIDPYGEIVAESHALGDDVVTALCVAEKLERSSGQRYLRARRPELYGKLVEPLPPGAAPVTSPGWRLERPADAR